MNGVRAPQGSRFVSGTRAGRPIPYTYTGYRYTRKHEQGADMGWLKHGLTCGWEIIYFEERKRRNAACESSERYEQQIGTRGRHSGCICTATEPARCGRARGGGKNVAARWKMAIAREEEKEDAPSSDGKVGLAARGCLVGGPGGDRRRGRAGAVVHLTVEPDALGLQGLRRGLRGLV